ncbi:MAG: nitrous oxide reductase family maturation protein NosD, partial [Chlamydiae bacterium]|nr:nitrous oxide reductase family maturation protein NosD [Chlamydiota bacterium]
NAVDQAESGDTLRVKPGVYEGPIHVKKSIRLIGEAFPIIDGQGKGSVVYLEAENILFKGFVVRNTGDVLSTEDTGLWATGKGIQIEDNRFENVLFGIYLKQAPFGVVRNNSLISKPLDIARRGDLIRVWYSDNVLIEKNFATQGRDVVLWFSKNMRVLSNEFQESRYGLHFMYCQEAIVERNKLSRNSVGAYLMYSAGLQLKENILINNRGPSGYGIGFKDMDGAVIEKNSVVGNRVGFFLDSCAKGLFQNNTIALNDIGMQVIPTASHNQFSKNNFIENGEQILLDGSSSHTVNDWNHNHWSDYRGFDANQDGVGDVAYRPMKLFERMVDRFHALKVFYGSPSVVAIDFAANTFPVFAPTPKFVDEFPLMQPFEFNVLEPAPSHFLPWVLLSVLFFLPMVGFWGRFSENKKRGVNDVSSSFLKTSAQGVIQIQGLTKKFGKLKALCDLNLEVYSGEVVALWGANGAGKTTLLRCLLGMIPCKGEMQVLGMDVRKNPKLVRRSIGYVPQETRLHLDYSTLETARFYARLRRVSLERVNSLLQEWGLEEVKNKLVQNLSGGMRQKLSLLIALLSDPPILFLDEPTTHLDTRTRGEFLMTLQKLKSKGKTLIFCSHRFAEISQMADRVIVLKEGVKKMDGKPQELKMDLDLDAEINSVLENGSFYDQCS